MKCCRFAVVTIVAILTLSPASATGQDPNCDFSKGAVDISTAVPRSDESFSSARAMPRIPAKAAAPSAWESALAAASRRRNAG